MVSGRERAVRRARWRRAAARLCVVALLLGAEAAPAQSAPTVTSMEITSDPGPDNDYQQDDVIQVTVTFSEAVNVTGTPRIKFKMHVTHLDTGAPFLTFDSGTGTTELVFVYTVTSTDGSGTGGLGIQANKLELNGGTIKSVTGNVDANLAHTALPHDDDHKVHGVNPQDTTPPTVSGSTLPSVNGATLTVTFSEKLDDGSVPAPEAFHVTVRGERRNVAAGGVAIAGMVVTLTLESAVIDADEVKVRYDKPDQNPLQDFTAGHDVATFGDQGVTNNTPDVSPTVLGATVAGNTLVITFSEPLDAASRPEAGAFTVSTGVGVTNVDVSGDTVTLTLASAVVTDGVTVSYDKTATVAKLRDPANNEVASFSGQSMVRLTAFQSAETTPTGDGVLITFTRQIQSAGQFTDYTVEVDGTPRAVSSASVLQGRVSLSVAPPTAGQTVTVSYATPAAGTKLTDANNDEVASFSGRPVSNRVPAVVSGTPTVNSARLVIAFDAALGTDSVPAPGDFTVTVAGNARDVAAGGVAFADGELRLTLASAVTFGQTVRVSYGEGTNPLRDAAGNKVADFGPLDVTNNTPPPRPRQPEREQPEQDEPEQEGPERTPVADAGADIPVEPASAVTLNGSASAAPDGEPLTWAWRQVSGEPVTLSGADTATPSFAAPQLPGALTFRLTVTDPAGVSRSDQVTVTVRDRAPSFGAARVPALTLLPDRAVSRVLPVATGGNGALSYRLTSEPAGIAGLTFDPAARRLSGTPATEGSWTFTYRADDADHNRAHADAAVLTFGVTVGALEVARSTVLRHTLAAVSARTLARTLDSIGPRFGSVPPTGLTLAGRSVRAPAAAARAPTSRVLGTAPAPAATVAPHGAGSRSIEVAELLRTSAFSQPLAVAGNKADPVAIRWSLWGRGDFATFAGRPQPGMRYDGDLLVGWLGVDARADAWVAGVALSHGASGTDYRFDGGDAPEERGRLETTLTTFHPYARWTVTDGLELRGVLGAGRGDARHLPGGGQERESADLQTWMASLGLLLQLPPLAGIDLAARADASYARMDTVGGADYLGGLSVQRWQGRLGLEASARFALHRDAALVPFVEAAGRYDDGDGLTGVGVEVAGGLRFTAPRVLMEARGRWLAVHTEEHARELGVSLTTRLGPGVQGRGLSLSVSPRWGADTGGAQALWRENLPRLSAAADGGAFAARIGYGLGVPKERGLLTPFAEARLTDDDRRRLRLGARFEATGADLGVELSGERRESAATAPEHALSLDLGLRF